jgi:arginase family enzyme
MTEFPLDDPASGFLGAPRVTAEELESGQVAVLGAPSDITHNTRFGTRLGPESVREASQALAAEFAAGPVRRTPGAASESFRPEALRDAGDLDVFPADVQATTAALREGIAAVARTGAIPATIGGDHYITYPCFLGVADAAAERGIERLGYLQLDGHLDYGDVNRVWGRLFHGSNARRISEHPLVDPHNIAWVGTQGFQSVRNWTAVKDTGATAITHREVHEGGVPAAIERAIEVAGKGTDAVYVTIDIDVLDSGFAPGTGGVVIGGMHPNQLLEATDLLAAIDLIATDVVEVAPNLDASGRTSRYAAEALTRMVWPRLFTPAG